MFFFGAIFAHDSGYIFSSDVLSAMDKYSNEVAECVMEKAMMRVCKDHPDVSVLFFIWSIFLQISLADFYFFSKLFVAILP